MTQATFNCADFPNPDGDVTFSYLPSPAIVRHAQNLTPQTKWLELEMDTNAVFSYCPGQFVQLSVFGYGEAPISICSSPEESNTFELCIRNVGNLTHGAHRLETGDWAGVRGPFGHGFPTNRLKGRNILAIAGGIGIAPLRSLVGHAVANARDYGRISVFHGAKTPSGLLFADELKNWRDENRIDLAMIVDEPDGEWKGETGVVTQPLGKFRIVSPENTVAMIAGPPVMYRFVLMELMEKGLPEEHIFFTLERRFECGMGKCGHCQLNDVYVCREGPVFRYSDLKNRSEFSEIRQSSK